MKKYLLISGLLVIVSLQASAHVIPYDLDKGPEENLLLKYLALGYRHIIPLGFDHILFILCVFFLHTDIKKIILQATMFTLAHSVTLALSVYGVINPPAMIVEPLIAVSILLLAVENMYSARVRNWRMVMIFLFGLVHGMGFAGALAETGIPRDGFAAALISFNAGVELGQLTIIAGMYFLVQKVFAGKTWYRQRIVIPASMAIALVAAYWTVERIFFYGG